MNKPGSPLLRSTLPFAGILRGSILMLALSLCGCAPLALSLVGAGAGAGISHQVNGVAARTFSEPLPRVKKASLMAARRMSFQFEATDATEKGQVLKGRVADLDIDVELEILSTSVTRVSVSARKNILRLDGATAQEVIVQIERALVSTEMAETGDTKDAQARVTRLENSSPARNPKTRGKTKGDPI
ncbi:DUF3568 family protein [Uliginosibacterium sp. 31-16]|uniref:DUF3568 family protein n=1 Tax=Uliginosibacterium sp. 31-16 TaxID=3068315 RepID=UPI00273E0FB9|nr:DUF3568 family protein [Uliginosibacterium sp. 31-16]MDP5240420.1 DUF3568 family protein [Uliginosibacterium sp. 31-16]